MFTGIFQSGIFLLTILLFYSMDFFLIHQYDQKRRASGSGRSWDFTLLMLAFGILLVLQPIFIPQISWRIASIWGLGIQLLGILSLISALALHFWARRHLQQFYAERVEVQPEHRVIDTGPYARIRHPVITSFFGMAMGLFLINPALTTFVMLVYTFWDFFRAARQEEELLSRTLPAYISYMKRTSRFVPRLWRKP
jgi:protein-S-isoprenylcysteine O-methyltransferase Ste14